MTIDEHTRHHVHEIAREQWGELAADTLMEMLPPLGWADVATKRDLEALEARIDFRFDALRLELRGEMQDLKASIFKWMLPTMLTGLGLAAMIARVS
ncbi:MAG: hypothetical protein R3A49_09195 [Acidimicrobiia bacterium]